MEQAAGLSATVGRNVRDLRVRRGLGQADLAGQVQRVGLNWTTNTVARIELGHREVVVGELVALGLVLEVSVADLLRCSGLVYLGRNQGQPVPAERVADWAGGGRPNAQSETVAGTADSKVTGPGQPPEVPPEGLSTAMPKRLLGDQWWVILNADPVRYQQQVEDLLNFWIKTEEAAGRPVTPRRRQGKLAYLWRQVSQGQIRADQQDTAATPTRPTRTVTHPSSVPTDGGDQ
jgi:transcriptional regulator with XRE-family HTH domain